MAEIGLVLGAGGITGAAYHSGTLSALAEAGWDARTASVIVGTSAGSSMAAILRGGFPPLDLAARTLGHPLSPEAAAIAEKTGGAPQIPLRPRLRRGLAPPASPALGLRFASRPGVAMAGLLPVGNQPTEVIGERLRLLHPPGTWPAEPMWICAVDLGSGRLAVFGRHDVDIDVGTACEASSAIPGFFAPVEHQGRRYVDGGVHSPTNADQVAGLGLDLVVVISPMSATSDGRRAAFPSSRPMHRATLGREVNLLRGHGTQVLTFQPTAADVNAMGRNAMDPTRRERVVEAALESARRRLAAPDVADRLEQLKA